MCISLLWNHNTFNWYSLCGNKYKRQTGIWFIDIWNCIGGIFHLWFCCVIQGCIESSKLKQDTNYSYYCYDIQDQCVKLVIINDDGNRSRHDDKILIRSIPKSCNLGYIKNIREIKYYENGSNASFVAVKRINASKGQRFNKNMVRFNIPKKTFSQMITKRIESITNMGLNNIQLEYQKIKGTGFEGFVSYNATNIYTNTVNIDSATSIDKAGKEITDDIAPPSYAEATIIYD